MDITASSSVSASGTSPCPATMPEPRPPTSTPNVPSVDTNDSAVPNVDLTDETEDNLPPPGKRSKKTTSEVWEHYKRYKVTVKDKDGNDVDELWTQCNKCTRGHRESTRGTSVFKNHLKSKHQILVGQQRLNLRISEGDDSIASVETYSSVSDHSTKTELEVYMRQPLVEWSVKHDGVFDILSWWRLKQPELPILSQLARDVLSIQVSTVASESAFSAGGRVVDPFRTRLDPEIVQALVCTKDWTAASRKGGNIASIITELDMESLERRFAGFMETEGMDESDTKDDMLEDMEE